MANTEEIDRQMASLDIADEENEELVFDENVEEVNKYELCLVGRFLSEKTINERAMKSKLADIWKPAMGITIKEIDPGIYLFQFYHIEDLKWVMNGGPWSFDNIMLALATIPNGENPLNVPLLSVNIWIQIHGLPSGFMTETVGKLLGNFFGEFLLYDQKNDSSLWRDCMRLKIKLDVSKPLKRKKKITNRNGKEFVVQCKYERLGEFYFVCGMVTHTDRFCRKFLENGGESTIKEWGAWLRAPPKKIASQTKSRWLREDGDDDWEFKIGRNNSNAKSGGVVATARVEDINQGRDFREKIR